MKTAEMRHTDQCARIAKDDSELRELQKGQILHYIVNVLEPEMDKAEKTQDFFIEHILTTVSGLTDEEVFARVHYELRNMGYGVELDFRGDGEEEPWVIVSWKPEDFRHLTDRELKDFRKRDN